MELKNKLKELRVAHSMTQEAVADHLGVSCLSKYSSAYMGDVLMHVSFLESLGKNETLDGKKCNVGQTPVKSLGVTDQHSQVQLYTEGPYDKVVTFLSLDKYGCEMPIPHGCENIPDVAFLGGHTMEELIQAVGRKNFGWLCDVGNFLCDDCDPLLSTKVAAKYAVHVHAKDFLKKSPEGKARAGFNIGTSGGAALRGTVVGHGVVPVAECLAELKMAGYDGYVSLEFEGPEEGEYALRKGYENLKEMIDSLG